MRSIQSVLSIHRIFLILFFSLSIIAKAQNAKNSSYYKNFDKVIGIENTDLYQGVSYVDKFRVSVDNYQFFKSREFLKGSVVYFDQNYYDLEIKYDVFEDKVLLKVVSSAGGGTLKLFSEGLEQFTIDGHKFVKIKPEGDVNLDTFGYYESSLTTKYFTFLIKHTKKKFERKDKKSLYLDFTTGKSKYVLKDDNGYYEIDSKKDVIEKFPAFKKEIDAFYNLARRLNRSDLNAFYISLFKRIEILLLQKENIG